MGGYTEVHECGFDHETALRNIRGEKITVVNIRVVVFAKLVGNNSINSTTRC